jgi:RNA polymerase Rpb1, domain 5
VVLLVLALSFAFAIALEMRIVVFATITSHSLAMFHSLSLSHCSVPLFIFPSAFFTLTINRNAMDCNAVYCRHYLILYFSYSQALEDLSLQYDSSVRNSENTVVQFTYGDDGLNPDKMENNDRPVDFDRLWLHVSQISPCHDEITLMGVHLMSEVDRKLSEPRFQDLLPTGRVFLDETRSFFAGLAEKQMSLVQSANVDDDADKGKQVDALMWNSCRVTPTQLDLLLKYALEKCLLAYVEPGEACGAIGAQSISEPGTQMTLKVSGMTAGNVRFLLGYGWCVYEMLRDMMT